MKLLCGFLFIVSVAAVCTNCDCEDPGSDCATSCDPTQGFRKYGMCKCLAGYTGPKCGTILPTFSVRTGTTVAIACNCNANGDTGSCDSTGTCTCKTGYQTVGTSTSCTACATNFIADPIPTGLCFACSTVIPGCNTCNAAGTCAICDANSNTVGANCENCQPGFTRTGTTGQCNIPCTDYCGVAGFVAGNPNPINPECSYAAATGITCTKCATSNTDSTKNCGQCLPSFYKGPRSFEPAGSLVPPVTAATPDGECFDCKCMGTGLVPAKSCKWQFNTRFCDCAPGYLHSVSGTGVSGLCDTCDANSFAKTAAPLECASCPAKCMGCTSETICNKCAFGYATKTGSPAGSCDICGPGFELKAPGNTCELATRTTIAVTTALQAPVARVAEVKVTVTVTSTFPIDYAQVMLTVDTATGGTLPEIKKVDAQNYMIKFQCTQASCQPQQVFVSYKDPSGYVADARASVTPVAAVGSSDPAFVSCPNSQKITYARFLNMMATTGRNLEFQTVAAASDPSLVLTTTVEHKVNADAAVVLLAADVTLNVYDGLSFARISPKIQLGKNEFTVTVRDTTAKEKKCTWIIETTDEINPEVTCFDLPTFRTALNVNYAKVKFPLPLCEDNTGKCAEVCAPVGTDCFPVTDGQELQFFMGETQLVRTGKDGAGKSASCFFTVKVEDKQEPFCTVGPKVVVAVPLVDPTTFRKKGECPMVEFEVTFGALDNSLVVPPLGVIGTPPVTKLKFMPAQDCTCKGSVGAIDCAVQTCRRPYGCASAPKTQSQVISTVVCDAALNCDTDPTRCKVDVDFTDLFATPITSACTALTKTVKTDTGLPTFASSQLRIASLQQDGYVFDNAGGVVTCTVAGLPAILGVGPNTHTLSCTDTRLNAITCEFTTTVVDREVPTWGTVETTFCGKELGPYSYDNGAKTQFKGIPDNTLWTIQPKDNVALAAVPLAFEVNGVARTSAWYLTQTFKSGAYYVKATLTDFSGNKNFCAFSFTVLPGTKSPTVAYNSPAIPKKVVVKTKTPTKFPTTNFVTPGLVLKPDSCMNRCDADGNPVQNPFIQGVKFSCSCNRDMCVKKGKGVKCCADITAECGVAKTTAKCGAAECGGSAGKDDKKCYCDQDCASKGDCCDDFDYFKTCCKSERKAPSCKGKCTKDAQFSCETGLSCYCDASCQSVGDCCPDYAAECK